MTVEPVGSSPATTTGSCSTPVTTTPPSSGCGDERHDHRILGRPPDARGLPVLAERPRSPRRCTARLGAGHGATTSRGPGTSTPRSGRSLELPRLLRPQPRRAVGLPDRPAGPTALVLDDWTRLARAQPERWARVLRRPAPSGPSSHRRSRSCSPDRARSSEVPPHGGVGERGQALAPLVGHLAVASAARARSWPSLIIAPPPPARLISVPRSAAARATPAASRSGSPSRSGEQLGARRRRRARRRGRPAPSLALAQVVAGRLAGHARCRRRPRAGRRGTGRPGRAATRTRPAPACSRSAAAEGGTELAGPLHGVARGLVLHHPVRLGQRRRSISSSCPAARPGAARAGGPGPPCRDTARRSPPSASPPRPAGPGPARSGQPGRLQHLGRPHQQQVAEQDGPGATEGGRVAEPARRACRASNWRCAAGWPRRRSEESITSSCTSALTCSRSRLAAAASRVRLAVAVRRPGGSHVPPEAEGRPKPLAPAEQLTRPSGATGSSSGPIAASTGPAVQERARSQPRPHPGTPGQRSSADRARSEVDHFVSLRSTVRGPDLWCSHAGPIRRVPRPGAHDRRAARHERPPAVLLRVLPAAGRAAAASALADHPRAGVARAGFRLRDLRGQRLDPRPHHHRHRRHRPAHHAALDGPPDLRQPEPRPAASGGRLVRRGGRPARAGDPRRHARRPAGAVGAPPGGPGQCDRAGVAGP